MFSALIKTIDNTMQTSLEEAVRVVEACKNERIYASIIRDQDTCIAIKELGELADKIYRRLHEARGFTIEKDDEDDEDDDLCTWKIKRLESALKNAPIFVMMRLLGNPDFEGLMYDLYSSAGYANDYIRDLEPDDSSMEDDGSPCLRAEAEELVFQKSFRMSLTTINAEREALAQKQEALSQKRRELLAQEIALLEEENLIRSNERLLTSRARFHNCS